MRCDDSVAFRPRRRALAFVPALKVNDQEAAYFYGWKNPEPSCTLHEHEGTLMLDSFPQGENRRRIESKNPRKLAFEVYMKRPVPVESASALIDEKIKELGDWRGKTLARVREIIHEADPEIIEEWKWMGSPTWSHDGIIAVGNAHKDKVKLTFSHGASLPDPDKLFNAGLGGNAWRAIDCFEGDEINERALKDLVRAAVDYNQIKLKKKAPAGTRAKVHKSKK